MYFISECVKILIDQLEPSIHKLIKIPLRRAVFHSPSGPPYSIHDSIEINYYIFAIGQQIPCIIKENNHIMLSRTDDFFPAHTGIESIAQISHFAKHVIDGKITAGAHIWESKLDVGADQGTPTYIYCSDEFRNCFKGARYQGWSFQSVTLSSI